MYFGIPCRHILAVFTKEVGLEMGVLNFNQRWQINYYKETKIEPDPDEIEDNREKGTTPDNSVEVNFINPYD